MQLGTDPSDRRPGDLTEPNLLTQRLNITHRQPAYEPTDHKRLQRVGAEQAFAVPLREQLGQERDRGVPGLRDLDLKLALPGLQMPWPKPVAKGGL